MTHKLARIWFSFKKVLILAGAVGLLLILLVLAFLFINPSYAPSADTLSFVKDAVAKQQKIEEDLRAYYQEGKYTFSDPLVIQDPYQTAPLTALIIFDTPQNSQISIHVPGETPQSAVDYPFAGYQRHHEIPVYGLCADTLNHVTISMKTQNGESAQTEVNLQTEPLPVYIQNFQVDKVNPDKYSPGFNFTFLGSKPVFDIDGNVRWYSTKESFEVFTKLKNGRFLFTYRIEDQEPSFIMEQDLLGKIYAIYYIADGIHHDIYELPTGNLLITSSEMNSATTEDNIIEVDRGTGHIVRSFDLKNYLDANRLHEMDLDVNDWLHLNSIVYDPTDHSIIISSKAQSAVVKMTYPGMKIVWILGPHDNWNAKFQPYLLTPVGENFEWSWSQHHATLFGPDVPGDDAVDILLFDNGLYRSFEKATAYSPPESYSRIVHYRINEASMTVEQVWEYGEENDAATFSGTRGSAYLLPNGDVLGTWGAISKDALGNPLANIGTDGSTDETQIMEVDPSNNEVVFECTGFGLVTYRTLRAGLYDGYSEKNAYLVTPLDNTAGNDLVDRSVMALRDLKRQVISPFHSWLKKIGHQILVPIR